jgi:DNA polymerase
MLGSTLSPLQNKIAARLRYYEDLGIDLFYRHRGFPVDKQSLSNESAALPPLPHASEEMPLPRKPASLSAGPFTAAYQAPEASTLQFAARGASLFASADIVAGDTLPGIREDLGECMRCKLHSARHTIVFGDGSANARLVFVGEGPGADEDAQGLPFVGRAGKLLTQMIQAMGLERKDVYICNVVKCRPPANRAPERDEVGACSPFLIRQIDAINPRVIVCLGNIAAQTLLETNRGISHFRGQWLEFRGRKLLATYHPAYLLRNPAAKGEVWKDLQKVMAELGLPARKGKSS